MAKWRKPLKNKKRFDARYFLSERKEIEESTENSVQQEKITDFRNFSFDSWLSEEVVEEECESHEEDLEELQVHPHVGKKFSPAKVKDDKKDDVISDEPPPVRKKKLGPVTEDPPMGLEESDLEEA